MQRGGLGRPAGGCCLISVGVFVCLFVFLSACFFLSSVCVGPVTAPCGVVLAAALASTSAREHAHRGRHRMQPFQLAVAATTPSPTFTTTTLSLSLCLYACAAHCLSSSLHTFAAHRQRAAGTAGGAAASRPGCCRSRRQHPAVQGEDEWWIGCKFQSIHLHELGAPAALFVV